MFLDDITGPMSVKEAQDKVKKSQKPSWALDTKTKDLANCKGIDEDSWHGGNNAWSSENNEISSGSNAWASEGVEEHVAMAGLDQGGSESPIPGTPGLDTGMTEERLNIGDPIIVTAPNEFEGKTGDIVEFSPSGRFVIVRLYNHGEHSMHLSDVEYNQYADDEDADEYGEYEDEQGVAEGETSQQYTVAVDCGEDGTFTVKVHAGDKGEALRKAQKIVRNEYDTYPEGARIVGQGVAEGSDKYAELKQKIRDLSQSGNEHEARKQRHELNRLLMIDRDRQARGVAESTGDLRTELARVYRAMAPGIERHRDSHKAGELYDALEAVADARGAGKELDRMMRGARNSAHMEYDTNPGGFENWFWFLPFATDEQGIDEVKQRLDAKCWAGKHKEGTKIKGGVRVNNCVPNEGVAESYWTKLQNEKNSKLNSLVTELAESLKK